MIPVAGPPVYTGPDRGVANGRPKVMNELNVIQLVNIRKRFGQQWVHDQLNLSVPAGKTTVVVGPSGVGKSVMIKYILGMLKPDSGQVLVNGHDVVTMSRTELREMRSHLGVLFQGVALFDSMTVLDNVELPLREKTTLSDAEVRQKSVDKLALVGISASDGSKFPAQLSGGMQKRVGLARALQHDPSIVLFDEPTTGLDPRTTHRIYDLLADTQHRLGYTAVIVSHDIPNVFRIADYVAILEDKKIQACVPAEEVRRADSPWARHFVETDDGGPAA